MEYFTKSIAKKFNTSKYNIKQKSYSNVRLQCGTLQSTKLKYITVKYCNLLYGFIVITEHVKLYTLLIIEKCLLPIIKIHYNMI